MEREGEREQSLSLTCGPFDVLPKLALGMLLLRDSRLMFSVHVFGPYLDQISIE